MAHWLDGKPIRMVKHELAIIERLSIVFIDFMNQNSFQDIWNKIQYNPIHKKGDNQVNNNYRPVFWRRICLKKFEIIT